MNIFYIRHAIEEPDDGGHTLQTYLVQAPDYQQALDKWSREHHAAPMDAVSVASISYHNGIAALDSIFIDG